MNNRLLMLSILMMLSSSVFGQLGFGGKIAYDSYFAGSEISTIGIGGFVTYELGNEILTRGGVHVALPYKESGVYSAFARDNFTTPQSIDVNGDYKFSAIHITADAMKFFGGGDASDGGFYGLVGLGLTIGSQQTEYEEFNRSIYSVTGFTDEEEKVTNYQPNIRAFIGYDLEFDSLHGFAELGLSLSANQTNGVETEVTIPSFFQIAVGVRFQS